MQDLIEVLRNEVSRDHPQLTSCLPVTSYVLAPANLDHDGTRQEDGESFDQSSSDDDFSNDNQGSFMSEYMEMIAAVKNAISEIQRRTEELKVQRDQLVIAFNVTMEEQNKAEVARINHEQNEAVQAVNRVLKLLNNDNKSFIDQNPNSAEGRIRINLHTFIGKKFKEVLTHFQTVQSDYMLESKNMIERQAHMALPDMDPEEISGMIDRGEIVGAHDIIAAQLQGGVHADVRNTLFDIQAKYRDVRALEKNVGELNQMFVELGALVDAQGEMLDCIEDNVGEAQEYLDKGNMNIEKARSKQRKNAKKATFCAGLVTIIIVILCLIIFI